LPIDRPIAIYCYTGQNSAFVVAYLRLIGYDAKGLLYGTNSFMNGIMVEEKIHNAFTEKMILELPLSSGGAMQNVIKDETKITAPRGGC
jgi:hypothetical protein